MNLNKNDHSCVNVVVLIWFDPNLEHTVELSILSMTDINDTFSVQDLNPY